MAWIKPLNQRAGKAGTDHKCQGSIRKLSDKLNVRNEEGKESGTTGSWVPGEWDGLGKGNWAGCSAEGRRKGEKGLCLLSQNCCPETDCSSSETQLSKRREV